MRIVREMFSIHIILVMLGIGLYMLLIQSRDLKHVAHLYKEGTFAKIVGWCYIVLSILGVVMIGL